MNTTGDARTEIREDAVEVLLEQAAPRAAPPAADEAAVRAAVQAEWRSVTGSRRQRRRLGQYAVAATVLLGLAVTFNLLRSTGIAPERVADVGKLFGTAYVLGEQAELLESPGLEAVTTGMTIVTGDGAGMGLVWGAGGGSLRVDERTTIEFRSPTSVFLRSGRVYFDSVPVAAVSSGSVPAVAAITGSGRDGPDLVVGTDHGDVVHVGTQYMAAVDRESLTVSVREGEVEVGGRDTAREGQQLRIIGGGSPALTDITRSGKAWKWAEAAAPAVDFNGRPTHEFLDWVGRETGCTVHYATPEARRIAETGIWNGPMPAGDPRMQLALHMAAEDLDYTIDEAAGTITVSAIDAGS